jgi:hypothetical protein
MSFMVGKSSAKSSLKLHLLWLGMQPLYQHVKICDLRPCYTVQFFIQLVSQCLKKDFDNALQEVLHAAMIFMQLATIGDRGYWLTLERAQRERQKNM